jgi:hypothetical protein
MLWPSGDPEAGHVRHSLCLLRNFQHDQYVYGRRCPLYRTEIS